MRVFFADADAAARSVPSVGLEEWPEAHLHASQLGVSRGRPFVVGADGSSDGRLNAFFAACPLLGVRSATSQRAYAYDVVAFARFLERSGKDLWAADKDDLDRYFDYRCGDDAPERLTLRSWNRAVAALKTFYGWARDEGHVAEVPFRRKTVWIALPGGRGRQPVETFAGSVRAGHAGGRFRFLTRERYLQFRSVGLLGRLPDGTEDPLWRGRHGARDAAFADFLVHSGARVSEAASLLLGELPTVSAGSQTVEMTLAPPATKGGKGRSVVVASRVVHEIGGYVALERANAVRERRPEDRVLVRRRAGGSGLEMRGRREWSRVSFATMPIEDRYRAVEVTAGGEPRGPMQVWLNERGDAVSPDGWRAVFARASARCRRHGFDLAVTPHMLRHTFAVHMLHHLVRADAVVYPTEPGAQSYRSAVVNPVRTLQRLLGHSSVTTTHIYLDCVADYGVVEGAASLLAGEFGRGEEP